MRRSWQRIQLYMLPLDVLPGYTTNEHATLLMQRNPDGMADQFES